MVNFNSQFLLFNIHPKLFFTHMIAYEASSESNIDIIITCFVNFLKWLTVKREDLKELREKKIFFSTLDSEEKIVEVIKEIDTCKHVVTVFLRMKSTATARKKHGFLNKFTLIFVIRRL